MSKTIHNIRPFIIGYIHLSMLGIITFFILAFLSKSTFFHQETKLYKLGILFIIIGFCSTELVLFFQGIWQFLENGILPFYPHLLFALSIFLPSGILSVTINCFLCKIKI